jgi:heme o synthase
MRLALLRAAHPEPGGAVTVVTALLAVGAGLSFWKGVGVTATVAASQLAVGWMNDAVDAPRDVAVGRGDKPVAQGAVSGRSVAWAAVVAAFATIVLALATDPRAAPLAILGLISALSYNWPLKSTVASPLPYAVSFAALPAFVVVASGRPVPAWLVAAGATLGAGAHFANVLPDMADDVRTGVRGLPHRLGPVGSLLVAAALLLTVTALLILGPPGPPRLVPLLAGLFASALLPIGGYVAWRAAETRWAFRSVLVVALLDVTLLVAGGVLG